jgi:hypothetical protein
VPLVHIPEWDFDWQNRYTFAQSVRLPAGSVIHAELRYDNSEANPDNPNVPPRRVRWGRETSDEMGSVTLLVTPKDEGDLDQLNQAIRQQRGDAAATRVSNSVVNRFAGYDKNGDERLSKDEMPRQLRRFFERLDKNGDGSLTLAEAKVLGTLTRRKR